MHYRPDIDGLRAIAVLLVVLFHAFPEFVPGGFIGVDIFFVISGFLISSIIFDGLRNQKFSFLDFYSKRIRRIFPALLTVLLACYIFGSFILFADEFLRLGRHIAGGAGFVSNFILWAESGYFDNRSIEKPLLHLWSLGIEEQFYIIWPLILWVSWKNKRNILLVILLISAASFLWDLKLLRSDSVRAFYSPESRFWELLIGGLLAYFLQPKTQFGDHKSKFNFFPSWINFSNCSRNINNLKSIAGISLISLATLFIDKSKSFPGWWALPPTIGAALLIASGPSAAINKVLSMRVFVWIGIISFPLYLWHWPLLAFAHILNGGTPSLEIRFLLASLGVLLSWQTYLLIEKPIRYGGYPTLKTYILIAAMAFMGLGGLFAHKQFRANNFYEKSTAFNYDIKNSQYEECKSVGILTGVELDACFVNPSKRTPNAVIIGDSHAEDKFPGIEGLDQKRNWLVMGNTTCPPVLQVNVVGGNASDCSLKMTSIIQWVANNPDIKTVALSFFGNVFLNTNFAADHINGVGPASISISSDLFGDKSKEELFFVGLNSTISVLEKANKQVLIMVDVPELPFYPRECFRKRLDCEQTQKAVMARQEAQRAILNRITTLHPTVKLYDPISLFCQNQRCIYQNDKNILYKDSHHLTYVGSLYYGKDFIDWLNQIAQ